MSLAGRSGVVIAVSISLALHLAGAVWFALRPPMFRPVRPDAPIRVALVPARQLALPRPTGGGGPGPTPEDPAREQPLDKLPRPSRARPTPTPARRSVSAQRPAPLAPPAPELPRAGVVESGPAAAPGPASEDPLASSSAAGAADLGIGGGAGGGSGGGSGGGIGTGTGTGSGPGRGAVEVKPRELRRPSFAEMRELYPEEARREGVQARVRLQLLVDVSGRVADVRVVRSAGRGFDEAATALARKFVFAPGTRDGRPVPMWITLTYSFEIEG